MTSDPTASITQIASDFWDAGRVALRQRVFDLEIEAEAARKELADLAPDRFHAVASLHATLAHAGARIFATPVVPHYRRLIPTIHYSAPASGRLDVETPLEWTEIDPWLTPSRGGAQARRLGHIPSGQEVWLFEYAWYFAPPAPEAA